MATNASYLSNTTRLITGFSVSPSSETSILSSMPKRESLVLLQVLILPELVFLKELFLLMVYPIHKKIKRTKQLKEETSYQTSTTLSASSATLSPPLNKQSLANQAAHQALIAIPILLRELLQLHQLLPFWSWLAVVAACALEPLLMLFIRSKEIPVMACPKLEVKKSEKLKEVQLLNLPN